MQVPVIPNFLNPKKSFSQDDAQSIATDEIRARDGDGLKLYDDGGNGIFVGDGGYVGLGTTTRPSILSLVENTVAAGGIAFGSDVNLYRIAANILASDDYIYSGAGFVSSNYFGGTGASANVTIDSTFDSVKGNVILAPLGGSVGIGESSPTISDGVGLHIDGKILRLGTSKTPSSASDTGNVGEICGDDNYIYRCIATNSWKRAAINFW